MYVCVPHIDYRPTYMRRLLDRVDFGQRRIWTRVARTHNQMPTLINPTKRHHHHHHEQGERIKKVYEATGVTRIDVTEEGVIRIAGPTQGSVLKAREMLELVQVRFNGRRNEPAQSSSPLSPHVNPPPPTTTTTK